METRVARRRQASWLHQISEEEMNAYTELSGDSNPIHLDDTLAERHNFRGRVVYGMLVAAFLPRVFAEVLPAGPFLCLSQTMSFEKPVFVGDCIQVIVTVAHEMEAARVFLLEIRVLNQNSEVALTGQAKVLSMAGNGARI